MSVNYAYKYLFHTLQGSLTCRKILWHEADGFTSLPKEVVLRILLPLKIHRPQSGLNPRTVGPMPSTITTWLYQGEGPYHGKSAHNTADKDLNVSSYFSVYNEIQAYSCEILGFTAANMNNHPEEGGSTHLWIVGLLQRDYTALYPRRLSSSNIVSSRPCLHPLPPSPSCNIWTNKRIFIKLRTNIMSLQATTTLHFLSFTTDNK
jgi:hypothetical protein